MRVRNFSPWVTFQQWQTTDPSKMVTHTLNVDEFIDLLVEAIDNLTSHSYIIYI